MSDYGSHIVPLYGVTIHHAIAKGDLAEMKGLVKQAEDQLAKYGDTQAALEALRVEIARLEAKKK